MLFNSNLMDVDLSQYKVSKAPETVYYIPNFITEAEERHIIQNVNTVPKPKWTCLKNRRLQDYGGVPHEKGMVVQPIPDWLQIYMDKVSALNIFGGKNANHVLVNEYLPGQGIMAHSDGPLFYPTVSTISCGSHTVLEFLTNEKDINEKYDHKDVVKKDDLRKIEQKIGRKKVCDLLLERRSLVIIRGDMYGKYLHSIREIEEDVISDSCVNLNAYQNDDSGNNPGTYQEGKTLKRELRISLTIRNVPKVIKINLFGKLLNNIR